LVKQKRVEINRVYPTQEEIERRMTREQSRWSKMCVAQLKPRAHNLLRRGMNSD